MNKTFQLIEIGIISSILGIFCEYFGAIQFLYVILIIVIFVDTFTGIAVALRHKRFSPKGLNKFLKKVTTYSIAVFTVRLLEIAILTFFKTTALSQVMGIFLIINENISVLKNLAMLDVPIPSNFSGFLLRQLKISGWVMKKPVNANSRIEEIQDIIDYQLPTFEDDCIKSLLRIYFDVWKHTVMQLNGYLKKNDSDHPDMIYFKVMNLVQFAMQDVQDKWDKLNVTRECMEKFDTAHKTKKNQWLEKLKSICYWDCATADKKEEQIIDSIVVLLYQTIIDVRKGYYNRNGSKVDLYNNY